MPVPLNAFVDVAKVWFTERLDYLVNDSIPVKPAYKKGSTPSDIDLLCKNPQEKHHTIQFDSGREVKLGPNLLVECKGWFDYVKTDFAKHLMNNLFLLREYGGTYLPKSLPSPRIKSHLFFFREEIFNEGVRRFGSNNFERVIIGPFIVLPKGAEVTIDELISEYETYGIVVIEMQDILGDLFKFIENAKIQKKKGNPKDYIKLRKTYTLEMLHLVRTYFDLKRIPVYAKEPSQARPL